MDNKKNSKTKMVRKYIILMLSRLSWAKIDLIFERAKYFYLKSRFVPLRSDFLPSELDA